jgi:hypothetical protein
MRDLSLIDRLEDAVLRLETLETLPKPYALYYAVKREGVGTGWDYCTVGIGVSDLRELLDALKVSLPVNPRYNSEVKS